MRKLVPQAGAGPHPGLAAVARILVRGRYGLRLHPAVLAGSHTGSGRWTRIEDSWVVEQRVGWWAMRRGGEAMARVADHLSGEDLEARLRSAQDPTATRHVQVIWTGC